MSLLVASNSTGEELNKRGRVEKDERSDGKMNSRVEGWVKRYIKREEAWMIEGREG